MTRHIVMFRWKDSFTEDTRARWIEGLERLHGEIPGLLALQHGPDVLKTDRSWDHVIIADFASWRWAFLGIGVIAAGLAVAIGLRLGQEARIPEKVKLSAAARDSVGLWRRPTMSFLVAAHFFAQATRYATYTFAGALLFSRFGLDTAQLGLVGTAVGVGSLIGARYFPQGWPATSHTRCSTFTVS